MSDITDEITGEEFITPEEWWENGLHMTKEGIRLEIADMTTKHLSNAIRFFKEKGWDTAVLEEELATRDTKIEPLF